MDGVRLVDRSFIRARSSFHILSVLVATTDATRFVLEEGICLTASINSSPRPVDDIVEPGQLENSTLTAERVEIKVNDD